MNNKVDNFLTRSTKNKILIVLIINNNQIKIFNHPEKDQRKAKKINTIKREEIENKNKDNKINHMVICSKSKHLNTVNNKMNIYNRIYKLMMKKEDIIKSYIEEKALNNQKQFLID